MTVPGAVHAANFDAVDRLADIVQAFVDDPAEAPRLMASA
jgi:hypothetical protein